MIEEANPSHHFGRTGSIDRQSQRDIGLTGAPADCGSALAHTNLMIIYNSNFQIG